jgi:ribosomal protein S21
MLSVRKRDGESPTGLMYRFNKRVKQSGLVKEVRKRRFTDRKVSKLKIKLSALHREVAKKEYQRKKKMGIDTRL